MDPQFVNEYTVSKLRFLEWAKRPVTPDVTQYLWIAMAVIIPAFAVISAAYDDIVYLLLYAFLELFCVFMIFFRKRLLLARQFKALTIVQGKDEWERRIELGDKIKVTDGNSAIEYEWAQVKEFIADRDYLILVMARRLGLRLDRSGFTKGTGESFIEYMKNEHAGIPIKVRKQKKRLVLGLYIR
ncbi:MAG TPA: YcxB family protein [Clostridiales bacterium]|nr:YcxB family protein [Clostridiales bacterium]HOL91189.1 YcxB family protein [Clostridiales bacterium]HPP34911.1 YcxB family protein [Clostridiales bacterium]